MSNVVLETIELETPDSENNLSLYSSGVTTAKNLSRIKSFGLVKLKLTISVEIYNSGSFRQINDIKGKSLVIYSTFAPMHFEDKSVSVWAPNNTFPTTSVLYAYSGILIATVDRSRSKSLSLKLFDSGFEFERQIGYTLYYRRYFSSSGKIDLYGGSRWI